MIGDIEHNDIVTLFGMKFKCKSVNFEKMKKFIKSHSEESTDEANCTPKSDDLEEAAFKYRCEHRSCDAYTIDAFKAGAEWQKQQMMKDAMDCSIIMHPNDLFANYSISAYVPPLHPASTYISNGDKVKIIIIKEE